METPDINNPKWQDLILSYENLELKSLAFQILVIRTKESYNNNELNIKEAVNTLHLFCLENKNGNNLMTDIKNIFGDLNSDLHFATKSPQKKEEHIDVSEDIIAHETLNTFENEMLEIQNDVNTDFENTDNSIEEKEKLLQELESLNNKVKETKKVKKKKGFFKRLFVY